MHVGLAGALVVGRSTRGLCSADGKARAKALGKAYPKALYACEATPVSDSQLGRFNEA